MSEIIDQWYDFQAQQPNIDTGGAFSIYEKNMSAIVNHYNSPGIIPVHLHGFFD
jgi:hypothetical protein